MRMRHALCGFLGGLTLLLLAGCGSSPPPPPPPGIVELTVKGADDVNPDVSGRASPVVARVYQLAATAKFEQTDFFQLSDNDTRILGPDLLGREEFAVSPGGVRNLTIPLKPGAQFIAIAVAYRDIEKTTWRAFTPVPPNGTTKLTAALQSLSVTLAKQ